MKSNNLNKKDNKLSLKLQVFITTVAVILGIITIFKRGLLPYLELLLSLDLMIVSYNNYKYFNKKGLAIFSFVIGISLFILVILVMCGVKI